VNVKSDWPAKRVVVVRKQTKFRRIGKTDKIILKKEFDNEEEAFLFAKEKFPEFQRGLEYERKGWEYRLDDKGIFIERIKGWKPSIEIEAKNGKEIKELFNKIGILELVKDSVPEIMRQILAK